jgi:hypothetical protein
VLRTGEPATIRVHYIARAALPNAIFELFVYTLIEGRYGPWCQLTTADADGDGVPIQPGRGVFEFDVLSFGLMPGECYVSARIAHRSQPPGQAIDWRQECLRLRVEPGRQLRGTFYLPHRWHHRREGEPGNGADPGSQPSADA